MATAGAVGLLDRPPGSRCHRQCRLRDVDVGPRRVAHVQAHPDARVHVSDHRQDVLWAREVLVFGAVVVDRDLDVVLAHEALDAGKGGAGG